MCRCAAVNLMTASARGMSEQINEEKEKIVRSIQKANRLTKNSQRNTHVDMPVTVFKLQLQSVKHARKSTIVKEKNFTRANLVLKDVFRNLLYRTN